MGHTQKKTKTKKARRVQFMEQPPRASRGWSKQRRTAFKKSVKDSVTKFDQIVRDRAMASALDDLKL